MLHKTFKCPKCGSSVTLPAIWIAGIEKRFECPKCRMKFGTGLKSGAILSALSLTMAICTANLGLWLLSSATTLFWALVLIPLWLLYSFMARKWWLIRKARRKR